jgi:hypothetical protein
VLSSLDAKHHAHARHSRKWRPKFLAFLAISGNVTLSARSASVSQPQCYVERKQDPDFAGQWQAAIDHFADLLEARATQRALEGDIEPVFYMGVPVAYIRKFSDKLQIEMLRAYKPDRYKNAGCQPEHRRERRCVRPDRRTAAYPDGLQAPRNLGVEAARRGVAGAAARAER